MPAPALGKPGAARPNPATSAGLAIVLLLLGWYGLQWAQEPGRAKQTRRNVHALRLAIERYATEDPLLGYPLTFDALLAKTGPGILPRNPYTGQLMREIKPGDKPRPGDLSYFVRVEEVLPGYPLGTGFSISGYRGRPGPRNAPLAFQPGMERVDWRWVAATFSSTAGNRIPKEVQRYNRIQQMQHESAPGQPPSTQAPPTPSPPH